MAEAAVPEKVGAGLLICDAGHVLLLKRSAASGNPGKWGLPGGNADAADGADLLETAMREASEEIGQVPAGLTFHATLLTRRGKRQQKHYTVYVASIDRAAAGSPAPLSYQPQLNEEHTEYRWIPAASVLLPTEPPALELHPVLLALRTQHEAVIHQLVQGGPAAAGQAAAGSGGHGG